MLEEDVVKQMVRYLDSRYDKVDTSVPIAAGRHKYEIDIAAYDDGLDLAIEAKATHGPIRQAIGQAAVYRTFGCTAAIAIGAPVAEHLIDAVVESNIGLFIVYENDIDAIYKSIG